MAIARRRKRRAPGRLANRSEEHTSELQPPCNLVCRLLLEKKMLRVVLAATLFDQLFVAIAEVIFPDHAPVFLLFEQRWVLPQVVVKVTFPTLFFLMKRRPPGSKLLPSPPIYF